MENGIYKTVEDLRKDFPEAFKENGDVIFAGLPGADKIVELPSGFAVEGYLDLACCNGLVKTPPGLSAGSGIFLTKCDALEEIGPNLKTPGSVDLSQCEKLASLNEGIEIGGFATFTCCKSLKALPEDLEVGSWIGLMGCDGIEIPKAVEQRTRHMQLPEHYSITEPAPDAASSPAP